MNANYALEIQTVQEIIRVAARAARKRTLKKRNGQKQQE